MEWNHMGDATLSEDTTEKDVGVTFDCSLHFRNHIKQMISKANSRVGLIKRSFSRLNQQSFKMLYKSLVRPILENCSSIWYPIYVTDAKEIEKVQRRATTIIPGFQNLTYEERLRKLNITTLAYRRKRTDIIQVFRIIRQYDKIPLDQFFNFCENDTRGHRFKMEKPFAKSSLRCNSFSVRVINDWNKLPSDVVDCLEINDFKSALETEWKDDPIKYFYE